MTPERRPAPASSVSTASSTSTASATGSADGGPVDRPLRWFGSSGIRGPLERVNVDLALRLGRAVGARYPRLVLGRDARLTGTTLQEAFLAGALASGADVTLTGPVPTPAIAHLARHYDLGVQVTASHNPAPDNGFKLWTPKGSALEHDELVAIEDLMHEGQGPPARPWTGVGRATVRHDAVSIYQDAVLAHLRHLFPDSGTRPLEGMRIALDCAHGAGALVTPRLLGRLGAELRVLGGAPDGRFPDHPSEPSAENLTGLTQVLRAAHDAGRPFDLGIAHDGDADRTVFLSPTGDVVDNVRLFTIVSRLRGDNGVALPVDASGVLADARPDALVTITPVGDIHLSRALDQGAATAACEPSGTWFFADWSPAPEGPYVAAYIALLAAAEPIIDEAARLPTYERNVVKMPWPEHIDRGTLDTLLGQVEEVLNEMLSTSEVRTSDVDGVRIDTQDGWLLVRPSGTEPVFRLTAEAKRRERAAALLELAQRALTDVLARHAAQGAGA